MAEHEKQPWVQAINDVVRRMATAAEQWRAQGAKALPKAERDEWIAHSFPLVADGFAVHLAQVPPDIGPQPKKQGRRKQEDAKHLLDVLLTRAEQVLAFLDDLSVPWTTNLAERDLHMMTVQHKISGTFRREKGATAFGVIRSSLSTMRQQGRSLLAAMAAVFEDSPFPVAWEPGT